MKNIRYPNGKPAYQPEKISVKNRGIQTEKLVNEANDFYLNSGRAVIHKKPTPVQIVTVDYPKRSAAKIKEAYFKTPSTTDYNGVYNGRYLDFDVKETQSTTSFPLRNIHPHQMNHLGAVNAQGGDAFILVAFARIEKFFLLPYDVLSQFTFRARTGRKSMTLKEFEEHAYEINLSFKPTLNYLDAYDYWLAASKN